MEKTNSTTPTGRFIEARQDLHRTDVEKHDRVHDATVVFEEYLHYAAITRLQERKLAAESKILGRDLWIFDRPRTEIQIMAVNDHNDCVSTEDSTNIARHETNFQIDGPDINQSTQPRLDLISHEEWEAVARATRNTSWSAVFFLITTDIFGPLSVPWSMSQLGYGPGIAIFTVFGGLAGYTGFQLWTMFMHLDSDRHPLRNYGDVAFRVLGPWARHVTNILQSLQLFFNVGLLTLSNGQSISQLSSGNLCFVICSLVFCMAGLLLGQVRKLRTFGWLANLSIWFNVVILLIVMVAVTRTSPNYAASAAQNFVAPGPVATYAGIPAGKPFEYQVIGMMQAAYSYAGTMLFCEFMSEMKRPWDFWKSLMFAQVFIYVMYLVYGLLVYSYQGQFTILISNQGLSSYVLQSVTNGLGLVSSLILACLYGNIGIKVLYSNIGMELLHFPPIESRKGRIIYGSMVPGYWVLASVLLPLLLLSYLDTDSPSSSFIVCSAIPSITNFSGLIAAICVVQFTYTFPPIFMLVFRIKKDSMLPEETFNTTTGEVSRVDGGFKRWMRGMKKSWLLNTCNAILALSALATGILGVYASIVELIFVFKYNPAVTSFGCTSPIGS